MADDINLFISLVLVAVCLFGLLTTSPVTLGSVVMRGIRALPVLLLIVIGFTLVMVGMVALGTARVIS